MNSAIGTLIILSSFVMLTILLLTAFSGVMSEVSKPYLENERAVSREKISTIWLTPYDLTLFNEGEKDLQFREIYLIEGGKPLKRLNWDISIDSKASGTLSFQEVVADLYKEKNGISWIPFFDETWQVHLDDPDFPEDSMLAFGANGFALRRLSSAGSPAILRVNVGPTRKASLCLWMKVVDDSPATILEVDGTIDIGIGYEDGSIRVRFGSLVYDRFMPPGTWHHLCVVKSSRYLKLYLDGSRFVKKYLILRPFTITAVKILPGKEIWIDDLYIVDRALSSRYVRRLAATSTRPSYSTSKNYLIRFEEIGNLKIDRVDLISSSGLRFKINQPFEVKPPDRPTSSGTPTNQDLGYVFLSGYVPIRQDAVSGLFLINDTCSYGLVRYWTGSWFTMGVPLRAGSVSGEGGLQLVTTPYIMVNRTEALKWVGKDISICLRRTYDNKYVQLSVVPFTVALTDLLYQGDTVEGRVIWVDGSSFNPRLPEGGLYVMVAETGDVVQIEADGTFSIQLSDGPDVIHLMVLTPPSMPLMDRYVLPLSGVYEVYKGGG